MRKGGEQAGREISDQTLLESLRAIGAEGASTPRTALEIAERQATLLLDAAGLTAPPVTDSVLAHVPTIRLYRWKRLPRQAMLVPDGTCWQIVLNAEDDEREQLFSALHEIKHLIDAPHHPPGDGRASAPCVEGVCEHFAACVLMPATWLRHDWRDGQRHLPRLAGRYRVPLDAMRSRLAELGLRADEGISPKPSRCRTPRSDRGGAS